MTAVPGGKPGGSSARQRAEAFRDRTAERTRAAKVLSGDVLEPVVLAIAETPTIVIEVAEASGLEIGEQIRAAAADAEANLTDAARALAAQAGELREANVEARAVTDNFRRAAEAGIKAANSTIQAEAMRAHGKILDDMKPAIETRLQQVVMADRIAHGWRAVIATCFAALVLSAGSIYAGRETGVADARNRAAQALAHDLTGLRQELQAAEQQVRNIEGSAARLNEAASGAELLRGVRPEIATSLIELSRNLTEAEARQLAGIVRHVKSTYNDSARARLGLNTEAVPFPCVMAGPLGLMHYGGNQQIPAHSCIVILPQGQSATGNYMSRFRWTEPLGPGR